MVRSIFTACALLIILSGTMAQKPNVLLIISDDLNTRIGPYMEIDQHTPSLDRLAAEGIRFTRTYCQYPLCGPSRASLMSGLHPETNGILNNIDRPGSYRVENPALSDHPSMAGFFREQGYYTARVSKIYHMGVPGGIERGAPGGDDPDSWDYACNILGPETNSQGSLELLSPGNLHYGSNFSRMILKDGLEHTQTDYLAASQAIAILESRAGKLPDGGRNTQKEKPEAPFFLAVGLVRPHVPFIAPENCFKPYPEHEVLLPPIEVLDNVPEQALRRQNMNIWKMGETQKKQTISAYMASVRFMDQQVGRLLDALDQLNMREETIVIFISDHGYNLGEHDCWSKVSLWEGSVRVPMIISYAGNKKNHGTRCETITELIDLYPTLTGLCGLSKEQPAILQGKSLAGYIKENKPVEGKTYAYTVSYGGEGASIRSPEWRYTRWGEDVLEGNEELYRHSTDPEETINLADDSDQQEILAKMRGIFESSREKARVKMVNHQE
ncbi:MAG: sulfatase [Bacteroidales bacterium]|nr:sulfatase [Bacteroidales bacterium]